MPKTILITGSTDGIGLQTAKRIASRGHTVLLHGRSQDKLEAAAAEVGGRNEIYRADLSDLGAAAALADAVAERHGQLDALINNAGVYKVPQARTAEGLDVRFVVNTLAPWVLTRRLLPIVSREGRIVNLSSAAQAPVDLNAMAGRGALADFAAYAQSKLALTIWTQELARAFPDGPVLIAVNPGSLLASKMVKEGFGVAGNDIGIGADILCRVALDAEFATTTGKYFDNDAGRFTEPHAAALDASHCKEVMERIRALTTGLI